MSRLSAATSQMSARVTYAKRWRCEARYLMSHQREDMRWPFPLTAFASFFCLLLPRHLCVQRERVAECKDYDVMTRRSSRDVVVRRARGAQPRCVIVDGIAECADMRRASPQMCTPARSVPCYTIDDQIAHLFEHHRSMPTHRHPTL